MQQIPGDYQFNAINNGFYVQRNWHKNKLDLFDTFNLKNAEHVVVDVGCGSGNFIRHTARHFKKVFALDNNEKALDFVSSVLQAKGMENASVLKADLSTKLDDDIPQADLAVCMEVLEHFRLEDLTSTVLPNIGRLIKTNGLLFITTPNSLSLWPVIEKFLDTFGLVPRLAGEQHFYAFSRLSLRQMLEKNGFTVITDGTFNHISPYMPCSGLRKTTLKIEKNYLKNLGPIIYVLAKKTK